MPVPPIQIISPLTRYIETENNLTVRASAVISQSGWGIKFILDGGIEIIDDTVPYEVDFNNVSQGEHTIDAYVVDDSDVVQTGEENHDKVHHIGTGGEIFVAMGDSITQGDSDDDCSDSTSKFCLDNTSTDGRNTGGGFGPILNNLLTAENGKPHNIINEGIGGERSVGGKNRIVDVLTKYPKATTYLLLYGTNDAWVPEPDGNDPENFRDNMQSMIDAIKAEGKTPVLAKIPRVQGNCYACTPYYKESPVVDPEDGDRNINIRSYNVVIGELASDNGISVLPPEFYTYFKDTYGDSYDETIADGYGDNLHPDGMGYNAMAELWRDALSAP